MDTELDGYLDLLEPMLRAGDRPVRLDEHGQLHLSPLVAETVDPAVVTESERIYARLPTVPLTEILIDVDRATGFTRHLTHAGGATPRHGEVEHRRILYAAILAQACNFGATRMAELTGIPADVIDWATRWYLREPTLRPANTAVVNEHFHDTFAQAWGGGTLSSSDGLRFSMRGKSLTARALSRYFLHEGVTSYTHVSDQHSTYGTQIIVSTDRDATYVLDEILGNTTELPILEHATDSHGQTLITFALFDLVGKRLSPRIAKLPDKQLWRPYRSGRYQRWPLAGPLARAPRPNRADRPALGRPAAQRRLPAQRPRLRRAARHPATSWRPTAPARESAARIRQVAAHRARAALVHRRSVPPTYRSATQPRRNPQRPAPVHLLRPPRPRAAPPLRRPDHAGALPHPRRERLHPVHDLVPARRRRRPPRRRARR
jgi:hypothetical protein